MSEVSISVVMATFNGAEYLAEQIESIFSQETLPSEFVLVDDCSTDNTLYVASSLKKYHLYHSKYTKTIKHWVSEIIF